MRELLPERYILKYQGIEKALDSNYWTIHP